MARFVIEMAADDAANAPKQGRFVLEPAESKSQNPTEGGLPFRPFGVDTGMTMPEGVSNFMAGMGKAFVDVGRGAGQLVGKVSRKDVEEARKIDAPLMETTGGTVGNIVGNVAALLPASFAPGANTLAGAATIGAVTGLMQPSTSTSETIGNTVLGGAIGPAANVAGRALGATYQGAKALAEPFFESGQNKIAARTLQHFAKDPAAAAAAARAVQQSVTGAQPTLAEATKDVGLAQLQRALQSADPVDFATDLAGRHAANNAARVGVLRNIAGDDAAMQAAVQARDEAAQALYGKAFTADAMRRDLARSAQAARSPFSGVGLTEIPEDLATPALRSLANRPMFQKAVEEAKTLAQNKGVTLKDPLQSLEGLHYIKLALDDMASPGVASSMGKNSNAAVNEMRAMLSNELDKVAPLYGNAKQVFSEMSKPINQMEVGQRLLEKYSSASKDLSGNPRLRAEAFNRALQDEEKLVKLATGFKGSKGLDSVFTPEQVNAVRAIADELSTVGAVEAAARASGSPTAQNLASQNVLRQFLGPTGLPETWAEGTFLNSIMRPVQWAAKAGEPKITNRLADALLNPQDAAALLEMASIPTVSQRFGRQALPWLAPIATGVANAKE